MHGYYEKEIIMKIIHDSKIYSFLCMFVFVADVACAEPLPNIAQQYTIFKDSVHQYENNISNYRHKTRWFARGPALVIAGTAAARVFQREVKNKLQYRLIKSVGIGAAVGMTMWAGTTAFLRYCILPLYPTIFRLRHAAAHNEKTLMQNVHHAGVTDEMIQDAFVHDNEDDVQRILSMHDYLQKRTSVPFVNIQNAMTMYDNLVWEHDAQRAKIIRYSQWIKKFLYLPASLLVIGGLRSKIAVVRELIQGDFLGALKALYGAVSPGVTVKGVGDTFVKKVLIPYWPGTWGIRRQIGRKEKEIRTMCADRDCWKDELLRLKSCALRPTSTVFLLDMLGSVQN